MIKKIAAIGSHGVGKSTLCYKLASYYKATGANVDLVQEIARKCPFPINDKMTVEASLWIYHNQIQRELEAQARGFDTVICDRSPFDTFVYAEYFNLSSFQLGVAKRAAKNWLETYEMVFLVYPDTPIQADGTRSVDLEFQQGVHEIFKHYFEEYSSLNTKIIYSSQIFDSNFNIKDIIKND